MTAIRPRPRAVLSPVHPYVVGRRINDVALAGLSALIPAALAIGVTIALPNASLLLVLALIAGAVGDRRADRQQPPRGDGHAR